MLRSLFAGVSGMKSNQTKMDVIGNNIANVSTTAFKSGRVNFKDMLSQTLTRASKPLSTIGGSNPQQVGLGVATASIDTNMSQGSPQTTNRASDLYIEGNGFFVVNDGTSTSYTRDGSFTLDANGDLLTADGYHVMGLTNVAQATPTKADTSKTTDTDLKTVVTDITQLKNINIPLTDGTNNLTSYSIDKDGTIKGIYGDNTLYLGKIEIATFPNAAGLEKQGSNMYQKSSNSGDPTLGFAASSGYGTIDEGFLEMSNVDLAEEFTNMIITSRAYQANSKTISTSDEMLQVLLNLKN